MGNMERVEMYIPGEEFWLPVLFEGIAGIGFWLQWTTDKKDYCLDWDDDDNIKKFWSVVREHWPELMLGDGQDYAVFFPLARMPAWRYPKVN